MTATIEEQIKDVAREIALRRNVYRNRVREGKMTQVLADKQIGAMEAVMETLKLVQAGHQHATADHRETFWIAANSTETMFRTWEPMGPSWTTIKEKALRFSRRDDVEAVFGEDEETWKVLEVTL